MTPTWVPIAVKVGEFARLTDGAAGSVAAADFASPKSSTLTLSSGVILMFAGFRSRWPMPFSWAASSASEICRPRARSRALLLHAEADEELAIGSEGLEDHLEGDFAAEPRIAGAIDLPHSAGTKRGHDSVRTEIRSRVKGHSRMRCSGSARRADWDECGLFNHKAERFASDLEQPTACRSRTAGFRGPRPLTPRHAR